MFINGDRHLCETGILPILINIPRNKLLNVQK